MPTGSSSDASRHPGQQGRPEPGYTAPARAAAGSSGGGLTDEAHGMGDHQTHKADEAAYRDGRRRHWATAGDRPANPFDVDAQVVCLFFAYGQGVQFPGMPRA